MMSPTAARDGQRRWECRACGLRWRSEQLWSPLLADDEPLPAHGTTPAGDDSAGAAISGHISTADDPLDELHVAARATIPIDEAGGRTDIPQPVDMSRTEMTAMVKGQLYAHPDGHLFCLRAIARHRIGDWGDIPHEDELLNNRVWSGVRRLPWESQLRSSYPIPARLREETGADHDRLWIITGASGRSYLLYPWEY